MISREEQNRGRTELGEAWAGTRGLFVAACLFSVFVNLLMLTGPLYMLRFMTVFLEAVLNQHWLPFRCW